MGLKNDVAKALGSTTPTRKTAGATPSTESKPVPVPVTVSPEAVRAMSQKVREWSGWTNATLLFGTPGNISPHASCDHTTHIFTANPETLVLNPHRVLVTVTPFRLRQEAVLTGALLHEAGHARHTHWKPRVAADMEWFKHGDGTEVTPQEFALASLMEEPRVEGLQARDADRIGAAGLGWTMRASAAHLIPTTVLNVTDPEQKIMDMITSWALRAGRQIGLFVHTKQPLRNWVNDFTQLLHKVIAAHLIGLGDDEDGALVTTGHIVNLLVEMIKCEDDKGPTMVDLARDVLTILFPETDPENQPMPGDSGCGEVPSTEESEPEEGSEAGDEGGSEDEQDSDGAEGQPEESEPEEGSDESDGTEDGDEGEPDESESDSEGEPEPGEDMTAADEALAEALAGLEEAARVDAADESEEETEKVPPLEGGSGAGSGGEGSMGGGFRLPTKEERDIQKGAERFLRDLISPTESSTTALSESPSATVDPAALAAWKADGGRREPRFFIRTRREVQPSPPVKVAILVDVSGSMEELQKPSAVLSWALAAAALDLRNFAGRGQQLESTLIHWGSSARVIQRTGELLPGIREVPCAEGTAAMAAALDLVEEELPGFFDITDKPVHRLLVQFTDWELWGTGDVTPRISRALAAGVNMVTVAPAEYSVRSSNLSEILAACPVQRGTSHLLKYNKMTPASVWEEAARSLS